MMRSAIHILFLFCVFGLSSLVGQTKSKVDQCFTCHSGIGDEASQAFTNDIHRKKGIPCSGCHGGDPTSDDMEVSMSKARGFIGVPKGDDISKICSKCHSDAAIMVGEHKSPLLKNQNEMITSSVHGRLAVNGKERIVQCTTCHDNHGIVSTKNPASPVSPVNITKTCAKCHSSASFMRMYNTKLPIDQLEKYRSSVHGIRNEKGDMKVAECASCHGSHDIRAVKDVKSTVYPTNLPGTCAKCHSNAVYMRGYKVPSDQYDKYSKSVHGVALIEKGDVGSPACNSCHGNHGAIPPGVTSISQVCGSCHALNASLFSKSPHKKAFDQKRLPECETCHGYHEIVKTTEELLGTSGNAVCAWCHKPNDKTKGFETANKMRTMIDSLVHIEQKAQALIEDAEQKGMEVSESRFKLRGVRQARLESRTMIHSFNEEQFLEVVEKGISSAEVVATEGEEAIEEFYFRRWGTGVATIIITLLAVSLYLMIRRIEKRQAEKK